MVVNFTCFVYEQRLSERVGYKTTVKTIVNYSCMYIRGYLGVYILVSTNLLSRSMLGLH